MSTIIPAQSAPSPAALASPAVYRMTVDEFERIAGSLDNDQVELVDGYLVWRDDMKPPHVLATERLRRAPRSNGARRLFCSRRKTGSNSRLR